MAGPALVGGMKRLATVSAALLSLVPLPALATAEKDVDLLSFDPVPVVAPDSDAPPVMILPPAPPAPPVPAAPEETAVPESVRAVQEMKEPEPALKAEKPKPLPPVETSAAPERPRLKKPPEAKPVPAKVKREAKTTVKPEVKPVPQKTAALPAVRPVLKVTPPPALDPAITPLPPEALQEQKKEAAAKERSRKLSLGDKASQVTPPPAPESFVRMKEAVIAAGDPLRIEVEGEAELSGWYKVMSDGSITMPLIGRVRAQGFTHAKLAEILTQTLKDGYLVDPRITVAGKAAP